MSGIRCLVFDIDDTLYLEREYVRSGFEVVGEWARRTLGIPDFSERAWKIFEDGGRNTIFNQVLESCRVDVTGSLIQTLINIYREHDPNIELLDDVVKFLEKYNGRVPLAVVTDGISRSQRAKSRALCLDKYMNPIIFTDELGVGMGKPHPGSFRIIQEKIGVSGSNCVYIADNPAKDFQGPKSLGWNTVRVRRQGGLHFDSDNCLDVDVECVDLTEVAAIIGSHG